MTSPILAFVISYDVLVQCFSTGGRGPMVGLGPLFGGPQKPMLGAFLVPKSIIWIEIWASYIILTTYTWAVALQMFRTTSFLVFLKLNNCQNKFKNYTECVGDLEMLILVKLGYYWWSSFKLEPFFITVSKNNTRFKSGEK